MNFINRLKSDKLFESICFVILGSIFLTLTSCNFILENNGDKIERANQKNIRIHKNIEEAKLLVQASKNNIDILELCEKIKDFKDQDNIKKLAENLETTHFRILKNYNELATEKLISIPDYNFFKIDSDIDITTFDEGKEDLDTEYKELATINNLELIKNKIIKQIQLLESLSETTSHPEFKSLAVNENDVLKSNINKIEIALNEFK